MMETLPAAQEGQPSLLADVRGSSRSDLALLGITLFLYALLAAVLLVSWGLHRASIQMMWAGGGMTILLGVLIAHSWKVKGPRQTAAFFTIVCVLAFFFEFVGNNYGWFFGTYEYTDALGPRLGGVPLLILVTWSVVVYSSYMLVDWLLDLRGARRGRTFTGRLIWGLVVSAATATIAAAWDLMADPLAVSVLWEEVVGSKAWWWWAGGPYLKELNVWKGAGGIPIGNFVGWWLAVLIIVFVFYVFFQGPNRVNDRLVNFVPVLVYGYLYFVLACALLEMNWYENGINQAVLIGTFTMMPVVGACLVKFLKRYVPEKVS